MMEHLNTAEEDAQIAKHQVGGENGEYRTLRLPLTGFETLSVVLI